MIKYCLTKQTKNGFTLIEILVGLTILGLLFGFGFVSFREFSRRQALYGLVNEIKGDLRLAQETALAGKKPNIVDCDSPNTLDAYNFSVVSQSSYVIEAVCSGGTTGIKTVNLPSDITIESPSPNPISFKVLAAGTNIPALTDAQIVVTQAGTNNQSTIKVTATGEIE